MNVNRIHQLWALEAKESAKRSWLSRGKITGMRESPGRNLVDAMSWLSRGKTRGVRESPGRNLVDTRSPSPYAQSLLPELLVPREEDFPCVKNLGFFLCCFSFL
jgi:hypothetical protein